jgi:microcystin-dependent protein
MGTRITVLPQVATPTGSDELPISQDDGVGGRTTYKATLDQIKGYVGSDGSGSVSNVSIDSTDGSVGVFGSPITSSGTISLTVSSVALNKLDDGGATGGEVLTYNGTTSAWEPGYGSSSGIIPNILVGNGGTTYTLTDYTNDTASNYLVFVGGVAQRPVTDFTISGSSIIFGSSIASGVQILVYAVINIATLNLDATPIGTISWFADFVAPTSYLECSGGIVAISDYTDLWYVIGTKFNTGGEGAGNFRLPDLRGEFIRGWDHGRGINVGRVFGSNEADAFKTHTHDAVGTITLAAGGTGFMWDGTGPSTKTTDSTGGTETRPRNVALLPCIKAVKTVTGNISTLNFIEKPAGPTNGQVLTYNGSTSTWVASAATAPGTPNVAAWVNFNGYNGIIRASYNVSSVTLNNPVSGGLGGDYTINFATSLVDSNYAMTAFGSAYGKDSAVGTYGLHTGTDVSSVPTKMDVNGVRIVCGGKPGDTENRSQQTVTVLIFR